MFSGWKLWRKFQILGVILSVVGFILVPISQIRTQMYTDEWIDITLIKDRLRGVWNTYFLGPYAYPFGWLLLPASIIPSIGIVSIIYGYLVKRAYG